MVEAAQVAGEVVSRSRVGLCDRAARQGAVPPGMRLHVPTVLLCTLREAAVSSGLHTHCAPSCSTLVVLRRFCCNKLFFFACQNGA